MITTILIYISDPYIWDGTRIRISHDFSNDFGSSYFVMGSEASKSHRFVPSDTALEIAKSLKVHLGSYPHQAHLADEDQPELQILLDLLVDEGCLSEEQVAPFRREIRVPS